jgi:hypothetical protein
MATSERGAGDPLFKQSVQFSAAMLSLVALSRSEPPTGRSKPRLEWEKQRADAKRRAIKALLKDQPGGIPETLHAKLLAFGQDAVKVGMTYETVGAPRLRRLHPDKFVAAILRGAK